MAIRKVLVLAREPAVFHGQFDLSLGGKRNFQQRLIEFLVIPHRKRSGLAVGPHIGNRVAGSNAQCNLLFLTGAVFKGIARLAAHRSGRYIGKYLRRAAGADHAVQVGDLKKGHRRLIWIAVVHHGLGRIGSAGTGQQCHGDHRTVSPPDAPG